MSVQEEKVAQCIGLWLAEGDSRTKLEITLTNNYPKIIVFFHNVIDSLVVSRNLPRVYVYSPSEGQKPRLLIDVEHKYYVDRRASQPYFIYRLADVQRVKEWKKTIKKFKRKTELYSFILQGFFAGEGNVKFIKKYKSRIVRVSQNKPNPLLEKIFKYLKIKYKYSPKERAYVISGRKNLEKLSQLNISVLHRKKDKKFKNMMRSYKQYHYPKGFLKRELYNFLTSPHTSSQLAKTFKRSQARITRALSNLKKEGRIKNFRVRSKDYWIRSDKNMIIISKRKQEILNFLIIPKYTFEIANHLNVNWKAAFRRLKELEKLNLVKFKDGLWYKIKTSKEVKVI